jgi:predicted Na+-dependent transporter
VVLGPIIVGMTARKVAPKPVAAFMPFAPVVGVIATVLLVGSAVAQVP